MLLDLREVFAAEKTLPVDAALDLSDFETGGIHPILQPVRFIGSVQSRAEVVTLTGNAAFDYTAPCDRCAEPVTTRFDIPISHIIVNEIAGEQTDEFVVIDNMRLPLDELIRSDIILELPYKYLCAPNCKGLCAGCGRRLSVEPCICEKQPDPRLAALDKFLE